MAEGAPELAGDDLGVLRHAAGGRAAVPDRRRGDRRLLHGRAMVLLQGILHRRAGEPPQDRVFVLCFRSMRLIGKKISISFSLLKGA